MKVGDIVKQGNRVIKLQGKLSNQRSMLLGTVIAIHDLPKEMFKSRNGDWSNLLGSKTVDVLWSSGKLSENFAERSLEVINESR